MTHYVLPTSERGLSIPCWWVWLTVPYKVEFPMNRNDLSESDIATMVIKSLGTIQRFTTVLSFLNCDRWF